MAASNIHYEIAERVRAIAPGGIGAIHLLARKLGLVEDIDRDLHLLKRHLPYHESDHVLNIAYNLLAGGSRLEHLEVRRNDEVYLDALGAERIPDPTTAGDFCRRFTEADVERLMDTFNETRLRAWKQQPDDFFDEAFIDADGTLAPSRRLVQAGRGHRLQRGPGATTRWWSRWPTPPSRCSWSTAAATAPRTSTPTSTSTRPPPCAAGRGSARSPTGATPTSPRRSTWTAGTGDGIRFIFGIDAMANLEGLAERLPDLEYSELERPPRYTIKTVPRQARERHKERIVAERQFDTLKLIGEEVAEFEYRPVACKKAYRVVVLRKKLVVEKGQLWLFEPDRYFFYITNDRTTPASEIVFLANDRCDQENLIAQLKGGVKALAMPVGDLVSNWAYMVMACWRGA